MCGIAGILYKGNKSVSIDLLKKMTDTLVHRGPDDEGFYINKDRSFGLGFRRLSIIDLNTGHQPISNEDGTIWVILNGEIYNFLELREGLEKKGHKFSTKTDTEVLVHLYEEKGVDFLQYLRGMFAFCIWDERKKILFLARDRAGKKPLVYTENNGDIIFASEVKAILQHPGIASGIDYKSMDHYLTYGYSFPGRTMFSNIKKLPPANYLVCDRNGIKIERYWSLDYSDKLKLHESEYGNLIFNSLKEATKLRMISDVPLGALLSGGVDSSAVVALMSELSNRPVKTFSIGFDEKNYSELDYARLIAKRFNAEHHEFIVKPDVLAILPKLIWHYNEPFGDSSCIPTYYVANMARKHVTVVLNGDGGDESFAGYERYIAFKFSEQLKLVPKPVLKAAYLSLNKINRVFNNRETTQASKICTFINILSSYDKKYIYPRLISYFTPEEKEKLYNQDFRRNIENGYSFDFLADILEGFKKYNAVDRVMAADILTYLPEDLLVKMDIATMANSLEGRSPFLDHKVMELAARIPDGLKLKGVITKYILKKSMKGIIPDEILTRNKMGFGVPLAKWFRSDLRSFVHGVLLSDECTKRGFFNKEFVEKLLADHMTEKRNNSHKIWALLNFELWYRMFIGKTWTYS